MSHEIPFPIVCPRLLWSLSISDKYLYTCLRSSIFSNAAKSPRNSRVNTFGDILDTIKTFVCRNDKEDRIRGMFCGVFWLRDGIAINVHHLRHLVPKCKSSINGSLQKLGFTMNVGRSQCAQEISKLFPILKDNAAELRKWTIRKKPGAVTSAFGHTRFEISLEGLSRPMAFTVNEDLPAAELLFRMDDTIPPFDMQESWELPSDLMTRFIDERKLSP
jgi:hypothetical protein